MKTIFTALTFLAFLLLSVPTATAETRYVKSGLIVTLRETPDDTGAIVDTLNAGAGLEVLSINEDFLKVRTEDRKEGWLPRLYTGAEPPPHPAMGQSKSSADRKTEPDAGGEPRRQATGGPPDGLDSATQIRWANAEIQRLSGELTRLRSNQQEQAEVTRKATELTGERDRLAQELQATRAELQGARQPGPWSRVDARLLWFLAGAGVLLVGWLLGRIGGRREKRTKLTL